MTVANIPYEFIRQRVELNWHEVKFGLDHQLLKPEGAIDKATESLCDTNAPPKELVELASKAKDESIADLIAYLARIEAPTSDKQVKAKWLYLVLAWLFENRESLVDSLGIVESVYSDFDYPKEIAPFVCYMPMDEPNLGNSEQNEARMVDWWRAYLNEAAKQFARDSKK